MNTGYVARGVMIGLAMLFVAGVAYLPAKASAQAETGLDIIFGSDLAIELSPANPAPGARVHAKVHSSLTDLSETALSWSTNGKTVAAGAGVAEIDVTAGALGSETKLVVFASEGGLEYASATAFIRPVELDLLWESDSYVPPFFRGRALPSAGTNLRLEAIPRFVRGGKEVPRSNIIFMWKRNGYVINAVSGRGQSSAIIESPPLFGEDTISVEAKTTDGLLQGNASARISSTQPHISLYQNHAVFGVAYHQALGSVNQIPEVEATFSAVPYYAQASSADDRSLAYAWRVNGTDISSDPAQPSTITINASGSTGNALIELALTHLTNIFLNSSGSWGVQLQSSAAAGTPFGGGK